MIPKIIHYCWIGGAPLPELAEKCIASWKEHMPFWKIMRWVCTPKAAVESQMPYDEYISYLNEFRELGVYPLSYRWIRAVHWYASWWNWLKDAAKTFLTNHPRLGYWFYQKRKNRKQQ